MSTRPWRRVIESGLTDSHFGGRPIARWWSLDLDCGHRALRAVRYTPGEGRPRRVADAVPPPRRIRCAWCPTETLPGAPR